MPNTFIYGDQEIDLNERAQKIIRIYENYEVLKLKIVEKEIEKAFFDLRASVAPSIISKKKLVYIANCQNLPTVKINSKYSLSSLFGGQKLYQSQQLCAYEVSEASVVGVEKFIQFHHCISKNLVYLVIKSDWLNKKVILQDKKVLSLPNFLRSIAKRKIVFTLEDPKITPEYKLFFLFYKLLNEKSEELILLLKANLSNLSNLPEHYKDLIEKRCKVIKGFIINKYEKPHRWIQKRAIIKNLDLSKEIVEYLAEKHYSNFELIESELDKLSLYSQKNKLTFENAVELLNPNTEYKIFNLTQYLGEKNFTKAMDCVYQVTSTKDKEVQGIYAFITYQFRNLLKIKWLSDKNYNMKQINSELELNQWQLQKLYKITQKFQTVELENLLLYLYQQDIATKYSSKSILLLKHLCLLICCGYFCSISYISKNEYYQYR